MSLRAEHTALGARRRGLVLAAALGLALVPLGGAGTRELPLRPCTLTGSVEARCGS